jgi:16S rRNA (guanine527-N7)-methyltransferase
VDDHVRLLIAWNVAMNLTAIHDPAAIALRHVVDSLTAVEVLADLRDPSILDLGSGGGFPGIPLAAVLPGHEGLLVESVRKKADFLSTVVLATGLGASVRVGAIRAEALAGDPRHRGRWPAVTARAVAGLAELLELAIPLLAPDGILVAWKRDDADGRLDAEVEAARRALLSRGGGELDCRPATAGDLLPNHVLVVVRPAGAVPDGYPREPAVRRRRPW